MIYGCGFVLTCQIGIIVFLSQVVTQLFFQFYPVFLKEVYWVLYCLSYISMTFPYQFCFHTLYSMQMIPNAPKGLLLLQMPLLSKMTSLTSVPGARSGVWPSMSISVNMCASFPLVALLLPPRILLTKVLSYLLSITRISV